MASLFRPAPFKKVAEPAAAATEATETKPGFLSKAAPYLFGAGTILSAFANERGASTDAGRLNRLAGSERATSQRAAAEERRRGRFMQSRARAVAASSGAGVDDPTVLNVMADLEAEGEYRALTRMYEGETAAQSLELEGKERRRAARGQSIGTILSGAATFASKYG